MIPEKKVFMAYAHVCEKIKLRLNITKSSGAFLKTHFDPG
jgi:hypothetical protein